MSKEYMVARDGEQFGPYESNVLLDYLAQGHVVLEDYIWCSGMANWETLSSMKEQVEREVAQAAAIQPTTPAILDLPLAAPTVLDTPQASAFLSTEQTRQTEPAATSGAATPTHSRRAASGSDGSRCPANERASEYHARQAPTGEQNSRRSVRGGSNHPRHATSSADGA
jgi:hypothetical protein